MPEIDVNTPMTFDARRKLTLSVMEWYGGTDMTTDETLLFEEAIERIAEIPLLADEDAPPPLPDDPMAGIF